MIWSAAASGRALVGRPQGRIDESCWQSLSEGLLAAVETARADTLALVIDLAGVDYMSSRGLRSLSMALAAAKEAAVPMRLAAPGAAMREILAISRYDKLFEVYDSVEAAIAA